MSGLSPLPELPSAISAIEPKAARAPRPPRPSSISSALTPASSIAFFVMPLITSPAIRLNTSANAIIIRNARERLRLFIFLQPPQAQIIASIRPTMGMLISSIVPT